MGNADSVGLVCLFSEADANKAGVTRTVRNFLIYAPPFTTDYGGIIALHKLCDVINRVGGQGYVHPYLDLIEVNALNIDQAIQFANGQRDEYDHYVKNGFPIHGRFLTPVRHIFEDLEYGDDWIVVYPEITFGNPLRARNVVRWLLHNPGFHSGRINYGMNEFHIRIGDHFDDFSYPGCKLSENFLTVVDINFELYNSSDVASERSGTAYCLRKGWGKTIEHDLSNSILIDGKEQSEIARIFKSVETFYSYDTHTTYSQLAALCGCDVVVVPDVGVTEDQWTIGEEGRYGLAYGVENLEKARSTAHLVEPYLRGLEDRAREHVVSFMAEANAFFG